MLILATLLLSNITVTLPAEASVEGSEITLGQIATITGADPEEVARIAAIELGYAPSPGFTRVVQGWKVEAELEEELAGLDVSLTGESTCRISPTVVTVKGEELRAAARLSLEAYYSGQDAQIIDVGIVDDESVPKGVVGRELVPQPTQASKVSATSTTGAWSVPVQIIVDDMPYRTVWVAFQVELFKMLPVLGRDIAKGQEIQAGDMVLKRTAVSLDAVNEVLLEKQLIGSTATKDLRKNTPVLAREVKRQPLIRKGDPVTLSVENGGVIVHAKVIALEDGFIDDAIQIQVVGTNKEIRAMVVQKGQLQLILGSPTPLHSQSR